MEATASIIACYSYHGESLLEKASSMSNFPPWGKEKTMDFEFRRLTGWLIGVIGAGFALWLVASTITVAGFQVPNNLSKLVENPPADVTQVQATCLPEKQVTDTNKEDIKKVTHADPQTCDFKRDSLDGDALWGALAFAAAAIVLLLVVLLARSSHMVATALMVLALVAGVTLGVLLGDPIKSFFTDKDVVWVVFWHGFFAAAIVAVSGVIAYFTADIDD